MDCKAIHIDTAAMAKLFLRGLADLPTNAEIAAEVVKDVVVKGDHTALYPFLSYVETPHTSERNVDTFDVVGLGVGGDAVYVDDEGLFSNPDFWFTIKGYPAPLAGNGLIMGVNSEGESISPSVTREWVLDNMSFGYRSHIYYRADGYKFSLRHCLYYWKERFDYLSDMELPA